MAPLEPDLLLTHEAFVRRIARELVQDPDAANDVVQEAWLQAVRTPPRAPGALRRWLAVVTRNRALDRRAKDRARERRERAAAKPEAVPSPAEILERESLRRVVVREVLALPDPYRRVIVLRYLEGLRPAAIAARLERPVQTVRTQLRRGVAMLRDRLDSVHDGDRAAWALPLIALAQPWHLAAGGVGLFLGGAVTVNNACAGLAATLVVAGGLWTFWPERPSEILARTEVVPGAVLAEAPDPNDEASVPLPDPPTGRRVRTPRPVVSTPRLAKADQPPASTTEALQRLAERAGPNRKLKPYSRPKRLTGKLVSVGGDSMDTLMRLWSERFRELHEDVDFSIESMGSATAPPALTTGSAQLAPMARPMKQSELDRFLKEHGYLPTEIVVARQVLVVMVHRRNPIREMTVGELAGVFAERRKRAIGFWGALGLSGPWMGRRVRHAGFIPHSDAHDLFRRLVFDEMDAKQPVVTVGRPELVARFVENEVGGIGYAPLTHPHPDRKMLRIGRKRPGAFYLPDRASVAAGKYPLAGDLRIYVDKAPGKRMAPLTRAFLRFAMSREGQGLAARARADYQPIDVKRAVRQQRKIR